MVINTAIVMATAEGIVCSNDSNLLAQNGGPVLLSITKCRETLSVAVFRSIHKGGTSFPSP